MSSCACNPNIIQTFFPGAKSSLRNLPSTLRFGSTPPLDSPAASNPQIEINPPRYEFGKAGFVTLGRARSDQSGSSPPPGQYETTTQIDRARCGGGDWSPGDAGRPMKTRGKPWGNGPTVTADFHGVGELRHNIAIPDTRSAVPDLFAICEDHTTCTG